MSTPKKSVSKPAANNDPTRFSGGGVGFKAKIIGIDDVPEPRGDSMCQESIQKLKAAVKVSGEHKQRTIINVSLEGLKLIDERSGAVLHSHAVNKISFIARDSTDSRAFGYIYGPGDGTHQFFGIKTEKAAENLVLTLRDLFQVVFELKKKEVDEAKRNKDDKLENKENEKTETNLSTSNEEEKKEEQPAEEEEPEEPPETALEDLLGLESELRSLQQGIQQMDTYGGQSQAPVPPNAWGDTSAPGGFSAFSAQPPSSIPGFSSQQLVAASTPPKTSWATFDSPSPPQPAPASSSVPKADPFNTGPFVPQTDKYAAFNNGSPFGGDVFGSSTGVAGNDPAAGNTAVVNTAVVNTAVVNTAFVTSPTQPLQIPSAAPQAQPQTHDPFGDLVNAIGAGDIHPSNASHKPVSKDDFIKQPPKPSLAELQQGTPPTLSAADPFGAPVSPCSEPVLGDKAPGGLQADPFDTSSVHLSAQQSRYISLHLRNKKKSPSPSFRAEFREESPFEAEFPSVEQPPNSPPPPLPVVFPEDIPPTPPPRPRDKSKVAASPIQRARPRGSLARAATFDVTGSPPPVPVRPPKQDKGFEVSFSAHFPEPSQSPPKMDPQSTMRRSLPRQTTINVMSQPMRVALPPLTSDSTMQAMLKLQKAKKPDVSVNSESPQGSLKSESPRGSINFELSRGTLKSESPRGSTNFEPSRDALKSESPRGSTNFEPSQGAPKNESPYGSMHFESTRGLIKSESPRNSIKSESPRSVRSHRHSESALITQSPITSARPRPRSSTSSLPTDRLSRPPSSSTDRFSRPPSASADRLSRPPSAGADPFAAVTLPLKTEKSRKPHRNPSNCSSASSTADELPPAPRSRPRPRPRSRGSVGLSESAKESPMNSPRVSARQYGSSPSGSSLHSQNSFTADFGVDVLTSSRVESKQDAVSIHSSEFHTDMTARDADGLSIASTERTATPATARSDSCTPDPFALVDPFEEDPLKDPFELESPSDPFAKDPSQVSFKTRAVTVENEEGTRSRKISFNTSETSEDLFSDVPSDSSLFKSMSIPFEESTVSNNNHNGSAMEDSFTSLFSRAPPPPSTESSFDNLLGQFLKEQLPPAIPEEAPKADWETFSASNSFSENLNSAAKEPPPFNAFGELFPTNDDFSQQRVQMNANPFA